MISSWTLNSDKILRIACSTANPGLLAFAIARGANDWDSGLSAACDAGHIDARNWMIARGADKWQRPLEKCSQRGRTSLARWILQTKRDKIEKIGVCLYEASQRGNLEFVVLLVQELHPLAPIQFQMILKGACGHKECHRVHKPHLDILHFIFPFVCSCFTEPLRCDTLKYVIQHPGEMLSCIHCTNAHKQFHIARTKPVLEHVVTRSTSQIGLGGPHDASAPDASRSPMSATSQTSGSSLVSPRKRLCASAKAEGCKRRK